MSKSTNIKHSDKAISRSKKRGGRKNYKVLPYAKKAISYDKYEADWLVTRKKYRRSTLAAVDSDFSRDRTEASQHA